MYGAAPLRPAVAYRAARPAVAARQAHARAAMRRRRESILKGLIGAVVVSGVLGFGVGLRDFKVIFPVALVLLAGYIYLLRLVRKHEPVRAIRNDWSRAA